MKIWKDNEVKSLFCEVEKCKSERKSLKFAFEAHATKFGRKPNSVRNYYYHEVDNLAKDQARNERLGVELSQHAKMHFKNFDEESEKELVTKIDKLTNSGMSVRSACQKLSGGNLALMTRFQNKYQNIKRKNSKDNIIPFRKTRVLTEADLNSLFVGLCKLIKKNAQEEGNVVLRQAFSELENKQKEIKDLKDQISQLRSENQNLQMKLQNQNSKSEKLKEHLRKTAGNSKLGQLKV